jgi:hypothetical protein
MGNQKNKILYEIVNKRVLSSIKQTAIPGKEAKSHLL